MSVPAAPTAAALADESSHHAPAHEPPPLGPAATPTNSVQPDVDAAGRDRYDVEIEERQKDHRALPGTFIQRDSAIVDLLLGQEPRLYPSLLYDESGSPRMSPQMLTYIGGPDPERRDSVRQMLRAVKDFSERDERGFSMLCAKFLDGLSYRQVAERFNVAKSTAQYVTVRFIEHVTDYVSTARAAELEQAAHDTGAIAGAHAEDDAEGADDENAA